MPAADYGLDVLDGYEDEEDFDFTVLPATAAKLAFVGLPAAWSGTGSVTVEVLDRFGNATASLDGQTATLSLAGGKKPARGAAAPALSGTVTAVVDDGMAVFPAVDVPTVAAGDRERLSAALGRLAKAVSSPFAAA